MFTVTVQDHMMVAHSLPSEVFGPAQALHGATYVVEVSFRRTELDRDGVVVDIGAASQVLADVVGTLTYRNLDELPEFGGVITTTEVLARYVADKVAATPLAKGLSGLGVVLREHPAAWAAYDLVLEDQPRVVPAV